MRLIVKNMPIATGRHLIAVLHRKDAVKGHLHTGDRITVNAKKTSVTCMVDFTDNDKVVPPGKIGLFVELTNQGKFRDGSSVDIEYAPKPASLVAIKKKLQGDELNEKEVKDIIADIAHSRLSDIELTYFVAAGYTQEFSDKEILWMIQAMIANGQSLDFGNSIVMDKHCIGGVSGNRTTPVVVSILAAAGLIVPKTSSRSITSPAGTADTLEVLCNVTLSVDDIKRVVKKCGACLAWGGGVQLAAADDKIIKVEHPLSLDPVGQLITSILAKKKAVGATHVLIDIPCGEGAKVQDKGKARLLKKKFERIGHLLGMKVHVIITDGSQPIGNGVGPVLEAQDIIWTLQNAPQGSAQLREKSLFVAGIMLEMGGKAKKGKGVVLAQQLLDDGSAYRSFSKIMQAQGGPVPVAEKLKRAEFHHDVHSLQEGKVTHIDNMRVSSIARLAGAPLDKQAGIYLHHHVGDVIKEDDVLYTVYAASKEKLSQAMKEATKHSGFFFNGRR